MEVATTEEVVVNGGRASPTPSSSASSSSSFAGIVQSQNHSEDENEFVMVEGEEPEVASPTSLIVVETPQLIPNGPVVVAEGEGGRPMALPMDTAEVKQSPMLEGAVSFLPPNGSKDLKNSSHPPALPPVVDVDDETVRLCNLSIDE